MKTPLTRLYQSVGRHLPFLNIRPPADRSLVMRVRPVPNPLLKWEQDEEGRVVLLVPPRKDRVGRLLGRFFRLPQDVLKKVELDEVGSFVWGLCDGKRTIEAIVQKTRDRFIPNRREAEISVTMFLKMLAERHYIWLDTQGKSVK